MTNETTASEGQIEISTEAEDLAAPAAPVGYLCLSVGIKFYVRQLKSAEKDALKSAIKVASKPRDMVLSACLCNHDGGREFDPETIAGLKKCANAESERLYRLACEHNGIEYIPTAAK